MASDITKKNVFIGLETICMDDFFKYKCDCVCMCTLGKHLEGQIQNANSNLQVWGF
jgi:hypothetical protein